MESPSIPSSHRPPPSNRLESPTRGAGNRTKIKLLVEVKSAAERLSPALAHFQNQLQALHALQLVIDRDFIATNPFGRREPGLVPARTLLSQLL
jgi:hypothetical protein